MSVVGQQGIKSQEAGIYQGHAFYKGFDGGKASGEIQITETQIRFIHPKHQQSLALSGLEISLGGASRRLVFIKHPSNSDWTFYTSDRRILNNPKLKIDSQLSAQLGRAKWRRRSSWVVTLSLLASLVLLPVFLFVFMDKLTGLAAEQVPVEWEQKLGKMAFDQYGLQMTRLETIEAKLELKLLTQPLIEALESPRFEFTFYISNDPAINAFALPGGIIVLNSGLILSAESANEVLGVLAHEISHVTQQHGIRNIISTAGTYLIIQAALGDASGIVATLASAAPLLIRQQYSRDFESEADFLGFELLKKANIDPQGLVDFFIILETEKEKKQQALAQLDAEEEKEHQDQKELDRSEQEADEAEDNEYQERVREELERWLSSHPVTRERIALLEQQILLQKQTVPQQKYINLDEHFAKLKALVEVFVAQQEVNDER